MKLNVRRQFGVIKVEDENGGPIASFAEDAHGAFAYGCFVRGLATIDDSSVHAGSSLFDLDNDQFLVGSVAELAG